MWYVMQRNQGYHSSYLPKPAVYNVTWPHWSVHMESWAHFARVNRYAQIEQELMSSESVGWMKAFNIFFMYAVRLRLVEQTLMIYIKIRGNNSHLNERQYGISSHNFKSLYNHLHLVCHCFTFLRRSISSTLYHQRCFNR